MVFRASNINVLNKISFFSQPPGIQTQITPISSDDLLHTV